MAGGGRRRRRRGRAARASAEHRVRTTGARDAATRLDPGTDTELQAGRLKFFYNKWLEITSDPTILSWVRGLRIPLSNHVSHCQLNLPINKPESASHESSMN